MVSNFNQVFTNIDLIKQIMNPIKKFRKEQNMLMRINKFDNEADKIIHICLKIYKMNVNTFTEFVVNLRDILVKKWWEGKYTLSEFDEINGFTETLLYGHYKQKELIDWIKSYFKCFARYFKCPIEFINNSGIFKYTYEYSSEACKTFNRADFCMSCKKYCNDEHNMNLEYSIFGYKLDDAVVCCDCFEKELEKKKIYEGLRNKIEKKNNNLKIKKY
jgi:hypothetical protein